ncbi:MAG: hypothetical protein ACRENP_06645 [Longimicrobiales bacterium]
MSLTRTRIVQLPLAAVHRIEALRVQLGLDTLVQSDIAALNQMLRNKGMTIIAAGPGS